MAILLLAALCAGPAQAAPLDISLLGLGNPDDAGTQERLRLMTAELAMAMTMRPTAPAETLGMSGFEVGWRTSVTTISAGQAHWQGGQDALATPIFEKGRLRGEGVPGQLWVNSLHVRKGLPFSFELGFSLDHLAFSSMYTVGVEVTWALQEGYKYVPDLSVRGAGAQLMGSDELNMTVVELDALLSMPFGVAGVASLTPYAGYALMMVNVATQVLDRTPGDASDNSGFSAANPTGSLYVIPSILMGDNLHHRAIAGLRLITYIFTVSYELDVNLVTRGQVKLTNTLKLGVDF